MGRTILPVPLGGIAIPQTSQFFLSFRFREREKKLGADGGLTHRGGGVPSGGVCRSFRIPVAHHGSSWRMVSRVAEPVRECPANERGVRSILERKSQPLLRQLGVEISCV